MIPTLITADFMNCKTEIDAKWVEARPIRSNYIFNRFKYAWGVFTGKYDAIKFYKQ